MTSDDPQSRLRREAQAAQPTGSQEAIDAERDRYADLYEFAPDAYIVTDLEGKILEANAAAVRLLNLPHPSVIGELLSSFVAIDDRPAFGHHLTQLGQQRWRLDEVMMGLLPREAASAITVGITAAPAAPAAGRIRWLLRDLTESLRIRQQLVDLSAEVELLRAVRSISRLTADPDPLTATLAGIVEFAHQMLHASVSTTIVDRGRLIAGPASDELVAGIVAWQREHNQGPVVDACRRGATIRATAEDCRALWPEFAAAVAAPAGLTWVLVSPLVVDGNVRGTFSVNLLGEAALPDNAAHILDLLTREATTAVHNADLYAEATALARQLSTALETRGVIEQAKGVLMARQGIDSEEAFDVLRRASQRMNRKLREVAEEIVAGAEHKQVH